ncbi:MAG: YadA-like family protein, partial [Oxalobacter sp.]|nr:YadA-like family protein [Oxalobacter sp.]
EGLGLGQVSKLTITNELDPEDNVLFVDTDTDTKYSQEIDAGEDYGAGSTTLVADDAGKTVAATIAAGVNVKIEQGENGEAKVSAKDTTYTAKQETAEGKTTFSVTPDDGTAGGGSMTINAGENITITQGENGSAVIAATDTTLKASKEALSLTGDTLHLTVGDTADNSVTGEVNLSSLRTHYYSVNAEEDGNTEGTNYNNDGATGNNALAAGVNAKAEGSSSIAIGAASAQSDNTIAIGADSSVSGDNSIAIGKGTTVSGENSIAIGSGHTVEGSGNTVIGDPNTVTGLDNMVLADNSTVTGDRNTAIGTEVGITADDAVAVGTKAKATVNGSVALGANSVASTDAGEVGYDPSTDTSSTDTSSTWKATAAAVSVGDAGNDTTRQITGVAAGTQDTDAVNVAQLRKVAENAGNAIEFKGDTGDTVKNPKTLNVVGGVSDESQLTEGNIGVVADGKDKLTVKLSKDVNLGEGGSLTVGETKIESEKVTVGETVIDKSSVKTKTVNATEVKAGGTTIRDNGLTINNGPTITTEQVNMNYQRIQHVGRAEALDDAATYGQLKEAEANFDQKLNHLNGRIGEVAQDANAGIAMALAAASLPQAYLPGKSMMAVAGGTYRGEQGYAIGFSTVSDNGKWIIKANATGNSQGHYGAAVGAGYMW